MGQLYRRKDTDKAFEHFNKGNELSISLEFMHGRTRALYQIGRTHGMSGNYPEALQYFNQSLEIAEKFRLFENIQNAYSGLGIVNKRIGNYSESLEYYHKYLQLADSLNVLENVANVYNNLGILHSMMKEPEKSMDYYSKALTLFKELGLEGGVKNVTVNIGVYHTNKKEYRKALERFIEGLKYDEKTGNKMLACISHANIANSYINLKEYDKAFEHLVSGLIIAENMSLKQEKANILYNLASLKLEQGELKVASEYSKKNIAAANNIDSYDLKKQAHKMASEIYKASDKYQEALDEYMLYEQYDDSLFSENKLEEMERQKVQQDVFVKDMEIEQQDLELELLNTRVSSERKLRWAFAITILLLIVLLFLIYKRYTTKNRINALLTSKNNLISQQKEEIEIINAELEKRMLRAQMNPHFIFNSLNSIQHLITNDDKQSALKYLTKFSSLLRQVLESSINLNVVLAEEIKLLRIYIELEALRFDEDFDYEITIDESLDPYQHEVPVLLVQPYIENAIIHGLMPKSSDRKLEVTFGENDDYVQCEILDNGIGRVAAAELKSKKNIHPSRGMSVTKQRLASLQKKSEQATLVDIQDRLDEQGKICGTRVIVNIPTNLND